MKRVVVVLVGLGLLLAACGDEPDARSDSTTTTSPASTLPPGADPGEAILVGDALERDGDLVRVAGALFVEDGLIRLCSAVMESFPPQCGAPWLEIVELDPDRIVGLTRPGPGFAPVAWADYPAEVVGTMQGGVLVFTGFAGEAPVVAEPSDELTLHFTHSPAELVAGEPVWWRFAVRSEAAPVTLIFGSGQRGDVALFQGGVEVYRWSTGMAFTDAIDQVDIEPGVELSFALRDVLGDLPAGEYELVALVVSGDLPEVVTTVTVR